MTSVSAIAPKKPQRRRRAPRAAAVPAAAATAVNETVAENPLNVEIEYIVQPESADLLLADESLKAAFARLTGLSAAEDGPSEAQEAFPVSETQAPAQAAPLVLDEQGNVLSKSALRRLNRPTVATLKQGVSRPGIVEVVDSTAADPELLVLLKGLRASVGVPRHWQTSTKFLSGKRGADKIKYELPEYIANTGISKLRDASDMSSSDLKSQMRERVRPKMGRIDIDYQVLHDAFFKMQTMPRLTRHGELYYEGKEFEKDPAKFMPGVLSDELRKALGMPTVERDGAAAAANAPPPWLGNMQRAGPPPSYPGALFPGVNAPIPSGAHYGTHAGGWGKPPVDQFGRSLYGDVFGVAQVKADSADKHIDKKFKWGGFSREDAEENIQRAAPEEEEEEAAADVSRPDAEEAPIVVPDKGPSIVDAPLLVNADGPVDLRKRPASSAAASLVASMAHKILEETKVSLVDKASELFAAAKTYQVEGAPAPPATTTNAEAPAIPPVVVKSEAKKDAKKRVKF